MRQQSGIALLSVMFVLTLMVLIAAEITFGFTLQMRRTSSAQQMEQARWLAISAEELAYKTLSDELDDADTVNLGQVWAEETPAFEVSGGMIQSQITDGQSCLNLNALWPEDEEGQPPETIRAFQELLEQLGLEPFRADVIAQSTRDWVDGDHTPQSSTGAEDSYYLARPVPYLSGNTSMRDDSELRAVKGVNRAVQRRIQPYVCALPDSQLVININTLSVDQPELLSALFPGELPVDQARDILLQRPLDGWESVDAFLADPMLANFKASALSDLMATDSNYFQLTTTATYADTEVRLTSLLRREKNNKFSVIRRTFGGLE